MNKIKLKSVLLLTTLLLSNIFLLFSVLSITKLNNSAFTGLNGNNNDGQGGLKSLPKSAGGNMADWWNIEWSYRIGLNITAPNSINLTNKLINEHINFTQILEDNSYPGTFDINSIRVIEYNSSGSVLYEIPSQFEPDDGYNAVTNAVGTLYFVLNGTTIANTKRYYFIYFDVVENGAKSAPNYNTGMKVTENAPDADYTIENNQILISMCKGSPPNGGSYYDHIYEVINKETNRDEQRSSTHWGWMLYSFYYGDASGTFHHIESLKVVANGSVVGIVKMVWTSSTYFNYTRYYILNYLDNSIQIKHTIAAKSNINAGTWYFASWWNPGRGDNQYTLPNSAYGIGGNSFTHPHPTLGAQYTSTDELYSDDFNGWKTTTLEMQQKAWAVQWDEDKLEGVGTVWGNGTYVDRIGYRSGTGQEGRNFYLGFRAPYLLAGDSFEFSVYGVLFSGHSGKYVEDRADGLRAIPTVDWGSFQSSGKLIYYHLKDIDNQPVYNATIELWNSLAQKVDEKTTGSDGNVTFRGLINDTYTIRAYYRVGSTNYLVNQTVYLLNQTIFERYNYITANANLTTAEFYAKDSSISDPEYEMLYDVNVTIINATSSGSITSALTAQDGWTKFLLPATDYNVSVSYHGTSRLFTLNISANPAAYSQNFTLSSHLYTEMSITISENKTSISINSTIYSKSGDGWPHTESIVTQPYSIEMYRGDSVNITMYYENIKTYIYGIAGAETRIWELRNEYQNQTISSGSLTENNATDEPGNYSVVIDSNNPLYTVGTYVLFINITKNLCQSGILFITIKILNHTSSLTKINSQSNTSVYWSSNLTITVNYNQILPVADNISAANMHYILSGNPLVNGSLTELSAGVYQMTINTSSFAVGDYTFIISGYKENITNQVLSVSVSVNALPTNISWQIPADYKASSLYMKVAFGENFSLTINYTGAGGVYIPNAIVTMALYIDENHSDIFTATDLGNGLYIIEFNTSNYIVSQSQISINAYEAHHEQKNFYLDLQILDYWNTQLELVVPPSFYPWSNNASYIFNYFCNEQPRYGRELANATISSLNVTIRNGNDYINQVYFDQSDLGTLWGYQDLKDTSYGAGYYLVWFLTSTLNISETTVFYAEPNISVRYYRAAQFKPYVWVRPPVTSLTPFIASEQKPVEKFDIYLDQSVTFNVVFNVTDEFSVLNGQLLTNALVTYTIYNFSNPTDILTNGTITNESSTGVYSVDINAFKLGTYKIKFSASLANYSDASVIVQMVVNKRLISYKLGSVVVDGVISSPQNREFTLTIDLSDQISNQDLANANISFIFNGKTYYMTPSSTKAGEYSFTFSYELLHSVESDKSYQITLHIQKENYTDVSIPVTIAVGLPVDPILGIPYMYWSILAITVVSMLGIYAIAKGVAYSRIPDIIKEIDSTIKAINKNKKLSDQLLRPTRDERIAEILSDEWEELGLKFPLKKNEGYSDVESDRETESKNL
ncbi:MAG: hypothetical protein ACTSU2_06715 [Promethearchaeota archaeon]